MTNDQIRMTNEIPMTNHKCPTHDEVLLRHSDFVIRSSFGFGHWSFVADWLRTVMLHYEVAPEKLQPSPLWTCAS